MPRRITITVTALEMQKLANLSRTAGPRAIARCLKPDARKEQVYLIAAAGGRLVVRRTL